MRMLPVATTRRGETMTAIALPRQPHSAWLERLRSIHLGLGARGAAGLGLGRSGVSAAGNGLLNNLVAYWPLNEAGGANDALDVHTNGLTLTQVSSPGADTGKVYATARAFAGSPDYFSRASETLLQMGDVDFTVAAWVYLAASTPSGNYRAVAAKDQPASREMYLFSHGDLGGVFIFGTAGKGYVAATTLGVPPITTWILVTGWHDATLGTWNIQCNGGGVDTAAQSGVPVAGASLWTVGTYYDHDRTRSWNGRIGPIAFWKSAAGGGGVLSAAQRTALWANGNGLPYSAFTT